MKPIDTPIDCARLVALLACLVLVPGAARAVDECAALKDEPVPDSAERQSIGGFSYVVVSSHWSQERLGGGPEPQVQDVLFVNVEARNETKGPMAVPPAKVRNEHDELSGASLKDYLRPCSFMPEPLEGGASRQAYFVFDIPKGHTYSLLLFGAVDGAGNSLGNPLEISLSPPE